MPSDIVKKKRYDQTTLEQRHQAGFGEQHERVKKYLSQKARSLETGSALPPTNSLVKELKVSRSTITRAIQSLQGEGILVGYRGSGVYTTERAKLVTVAFAVGWSIHKLSGFDQTLIDALITHCSKYGMFVESHFMGDDERPDLQRRRQFHLAIKEGRYAGILTVVGISGFRWIEELRRYSLPITTLAARDVMAEKTVLIDLSDFEERGAEFLCRQGASKIGIFDFDCQMVEKASHFPKTLADHGLKYHPELSVNVEHEDPIELSGYRTFMREWKKWAIKPDGLISVNDQVTQGIVRAAIDLGIEIPKQLKIVSHANKDLTTLPVRGILRLEVDVDLAAHSMLALLKDSLEGRNHTDIRTLKLSSVSDD